MTTILIILLIICLIGVPWGGYHSYGYGPSGIIGLLLVVMLILVLLGYI